MLLFVLFATCNSRFGVVFAHSCAWLNASLSASNAQLAILSALPTVRTKANQRSQKQTAAAAAAAAVAAPPIFFRVLNHSSAVFAPVFLRRGHCHRLLALLKQPRWQRRPVAVTHRRRRAHVENFWHMKRRSQRLSSTGGAIVAITLTETALFINAGRAGKTFWIISGSRELSELQCNSFASRGKLMAVSGWQALWSQQCKAEEEKTEEKLGDVRTTSWGRCCTWADKDQDRRRRWSQTAAVFKMLQTSVEAHQHEGKFACVRRNVSGLKSRNGLKRRINTRREMSGWLKKEFKTKRGKII